MAKEPAAPVEKKPLGGPANTVDASFARTNSTAIEMGGAKPKPTTVKGGAQAMDFNADGKGAVRGSQTYDPDNPPEDDDDEQGTSEGGPEEEGEEQEAPAEADDEPDNDLGEFKADDAATVAKYDERYLQKDGSPNLDALSAEWMGNAKDGKPGSLNKQTYDYLKSTFGLNKEQVKEIEAGQAAKTAQLQNSIFERAGGKPNLDAALKWGKEGGYSKADQDRFNRAMASNDPSAVNDAVDLLVARYDRTKGNTQRQLPRARNAQRNVTNDARREPAAAQGYASRAEWSKAFKEARASKDPQQIKAVRDKLQVSAWRTQG